MLGYDAKNRQYFSSNIIYAQVGMRTALCNTLVISLTVHWSLSILIRSYVETVE